MEKLTKQDLLVLSAYTGYCMGVSAEDTIAFIEDIVGYELSKKLLTDRKVMAKYKGAIRMAYANVCNKLKRITE